MSCDWAYFAALSCNLHGACGGKEHGSLRAGVPRHVAICTGRVEAKHAEHQVRQYPDCCNLHGACGGKDLMIKEVESLFVAICTGRVEAKASLVLPVENGTSCNLHGACGGKGPAELHREGICPVAICTGRVEAKCPSWILCLPRRALQSARGVWRQRLGCRPSTPIHPVAICTGRVEAKAFQNDDFVHDFRCNLHGACGGKD